jgi:hypothetical protein
MRVPFCHLLQNESRNIYAAGDSAGHFHHTRGVNFVLCCHGHRQSELLMTLSSSHTLSFTDWPHLSSHTPSFTHWSPVRSYDTPLVSENPRQQLSRKVWLAASACSCIQCPHRTASPRSSRQWDGKYTCLHTEALAAVLVTCTSAAHKADLRTDEQLSWHGRDT